MSFKAKTLLIGMPPNIPQEDAEDISHVLGQHFPNLDVVVVAGLQYAKVVDNS